MHNKLALPLGLAVVLGGVGAAAAHHSVAQYDLADRSRQHVSGTVRKMEWQNPHAWMWLDVPKADGSVESFGGEMSSLGALRNSGFKWNTVKVGDKLSIDVAPMRSGKAAGLVTKITWADGRVWEPVGSASPLPPKGQQAPGQQPGDVVSNAKEAPGVRK
jgi:hypothetical protein